MPLVPLRWLALGLVALALQAHAETVEYRNEDGGGRLLLDRTGRGISIDLVGINGHTCDVQGRLAGPKLDRVEAQESCRFELRPKPQGGIEVVVGEASREACRMLCGARAWFEGDYLPLPAACTDAGLQRQNGLALKAYQGKRYDEAFQLWSQTLATCEKRMTWATTWRWRNDAAIAAAHAGRTADCQRLSNAVLAEARNFTLEGETEPFTYAPSDAETAKPLIAAARHNLAKCKAAR